MTDPLAADAERNAAGWLPPVLTPLAAARSSKGGDFPGTSETTFDGISYRSDIPVSD